MNNDKTLPYKLDRPTLTRRELVNLDSKLRNDLKNSPLAEFINAYTFRVPRMLELELNLGELLFSEKSLKESIDSWIPDYHMGQIRSGIRKQILDKLSSLGFKLDFGKKLIYFIDMDQLSSSLTPAEA